MAFRAWSSRLRPGRLVGHHPAAVDQEDDPLALAGLEVLDGQFPPPGGRPPVDVLVVVVDRVVAEPLEVVVLADAPRAADAQQAQPVGAGQDGVLAELLHVGIDVQRGPAGIVEQPLPEPQPAAGRAGGPARAETPRGGPARST